MPARPPTSSFLVGDLVMAIAEMVSHRPATIAAMARVEKRWTVPACRILYREVFMCPQNVFNLNRTLETAPGDGQIAQLHWIRRMRVDASSCIGEAGEFLSSCRRIWLLIRNLEALTLVHVDAYVADLSAISWDGLTHLFLVDCDNIDLITQHCPTLRFCQLHRNHSNIPTSRFRSNTFEVVFPCRNSARHRYEAYTALDCIDFDSGSAFYFAGYVRGSGVSRVPTHLVDISLPSSAVRSLEPGAFTVLRRIRIHMLSATSTVSDLSQIFQKLNSFPNLECARLLISVTMLNWIDLLVEIMDYIGGANGNIRLWRFDLDIAPRLKVSNRIEDVGWALEHTDILEAFIDTLFDRLQVSDNYSIVYGVGRHHTIRDWNPLLLRGRYDSD